jgi:hypothetical protein
MHEALLDAEISGIGRVVELGRTAEDADRKVWESVGVVLGERTYRDAHVAAAWPPAREDGAMRLALCVEGDDPAHYAELFFHDAFLMLNLAAPGSFGGTISLVGAHDFALEARLFEYAWATAARAVAPRIEGLPLPRVAAWYDAQRIDATRPANSPVARALFHLLHLARSAEDDVLSVVRLSQAAEALGTGDPMLFMLRDAVVRGDAPVSHPIVDDDERSLQRVDIADRAAAAVVGALQALIRRG